METERSRYAIFGKKVYEDPSPTQRAFRAEGHEMNDFEVLLVIVAFAALCDLMFWG